MTEPFNPNAKTLSITILCKSCGHKFPSPIFMTPRGAFDSATLIWNTTICPACRTPMSCNKENFVARFEGGGFIGNDAI